MNLFKKKNSEFFGSYLSVAHDTPWEYLIAVQDWLQNERGLTYIKMPIGQILAGAKKYGTSYVIIDKEGLIYPSFSIPEGYTEIKISVTYKVSSVRLCPNTIEVLGKVYNTSELERAIKSLNQVK